MTRKKISQAKSAQHSILGHSFQTQNAREHTEFCARLGQSCARRRVEHKHDNVRLTKVALPHAAETGLAAEVPQRERRAPAGAAQLFDWEWEGIENMENADGSGGNDFF